MPLYVMHFSYFVSLVLHGLLHTVGRADGHDGTYQLRSQLHPLLLDVPPIQVVVVVVVVVVVDLT